MTQSYEEVREGSAPAQEVVPDPTAEGRAHARETLPGPTPVALDAVTHSARAAWRLAQAAIAAADRAGSLGDAQPPALRQARQWHHRCAGHYQAALIRWPRLAWGYVHLLAVVPAVRFAEWVTASPARLTVALAVLAAFWYGR